MNKISRALRRFVSNLNGKNKVLFFIVLLMICIVAICVGIYSQYFYKYSDTDPLMLGIHIGSKKTQEEYANLKNNFSNIFTNELHVNSENLNVNDRVEPSNPIVYTGYEIQNDDETYYHVDINLPTLNINSEVAKKINAEIKEKFYDTANKIMRSTEEYTIYNVSYVAYVNDMAVSIVVKETAKYGTKAETVTITTYNYSIPDKKEINLDKLIELKNTDKETVQKAINETITVAANNASAIANEYGATFVRNVNDEMYKVDNANTYFLTDDGYVYIVYDYGKQVETNEIDIVIF